MSLPLLIRDDNRISRSGGFGPVQPAVVTDPVSRLVFRRYLVWSDRICHIPVSVSLAIQSACVSQWRKFSYSIIGRVDGLAFLYQLAGCVDDRARLFGGCSARRERDLFEALGDGF